MLELETCGKTFSVGAFGTKEFVAVRDVSFGVGSGEVVSLIGESGSGKSTIGKMILRLLRVTAGEITFEGSDISALDGRKLKDYYGNVQGVFQDPFSSYNPIFKASRVFTMLRSEYFAGRGHPGVARQARPLAGVGRARTRARCSTSTRTSSAAASCSGC